MALRIVLEPRENLFIHSGDPRGRFDKTLSVRILADRRKYLAYSRLDSLLSIISPRLHENKFDDTVGVVGDIINLRC